MEDHLLLFYEMHDDDPEGNVLFHEIDNCSFATKMKKDQNPRIWVTGQKPWISGTLKIHRGLRDTNDLKCKSNGFCVSRLAQLLQLDGRAWTLKQTGWCQWSDDDDDDDDDGDGSPASPVNQQHKTYR